MAGVQELSELVSAETDAPSALGMAAWSDDRRKDFVKTLAQRTAASRYILIETASRVAHEARGKRILGPAEYEKACSELSRQNGHSLSLASGRDKKELDEIAHARAHEIIEQLPSLKKALQVLAPELASSVDRKAKLTDQVNELHDKLVEISKTIKLSELDPNMTVGALLKQVADTDAARTVLVRKIDAIATELREIDVSIGKALLAGVPGLSVEILNVVNGLLKRASDLAQLERRMSEQVQFGDSVVARDILKQYEVDEVAVADDFKTTFNAALEKLKLTKSKPASGKKALRGG